MTDHPSGSHGDLERRDFLKLGAAGLAASVAACAPGPRPVDMPPAQPASGVPPGGPGSGTGPGSGAGPTPGQQERPPDIGSLIDPSVVGEETWQEPWVWRADDWAAPLELNVVRYQNPAPSPSPGNPAPALFSYNGVNPAPTIRVRGDEFGLRIRNLLGPNLQQTQIGPAPDPVDLTTDTTRTICSLAETQVRGGDPDDPRPCNPFVYPEQLIETVGVEVRPGWSLKGHLNGQNATHTTNIHTHGLHVSPGTNPDGTHSDNVLLRILPRGDLQTRLASDDEDLHVLGPNEHVGELEYRILLTHERDGVRHPHPPGTHWYHPHSHGATHDQVASGMAGLIIIEGDVDEAINRALTGEPWPEPDLATGPHDYRERQMLIQRVFVGSVDLDAGPRRNTVRFPPLEAVNGAKPANLMMMRPGAVERWRVLNGSVDGSGTKRFMVLDGQFVLRGDRIWRVVAEGEGEARSRRLEPVTLQDLESAKLPLYQLSFDGLTLVEEGPDGTRHTIRDLSTVNAGTEHPFARAPRPGEDEPTARLRAFEDCFRDGESLGRAFVRPNEVFLGNANRADLFFKAPLDGAGRTLTVLAKELHLHTDNFQVQLQIVRQGGPGGFFKPDFDTVVGYIYVDGDPVEGGDFDVLSLREVLPDVPRLLRPIAEDELRVGPDEAARTGVAPGAARTRVLSYSGTGGATFPLIPFPPDLAAATPELEDRLWGVEDGVHVLLPNLTRTMAVHPDFDLAANPDPGPPLKFSPGYGRHARVLVDTAEEWVLYNCSQTLWGYTDRERFPRPGTWNQHFHSYVVSRAEGQRRNREERAFAITSRASDHPFHIHVNPMWVLRVEVPDENGELHNVLPAPQWMDTVPIPRNGGRVVFRTRFDDFVGTWVHHCHILAHEDMGMMQLVECSDRPESANYRARDEVASSDMASATVSGIYPRPSVELMYRQNLSFVDENEIGGYAYPGFELEAPRLGD
ncbi:MAG: multicopper oxidase domain-containing protein [Gemmatimonadota bacterium]|nr:multicopper oxidase domain-containing protein [Gemmatimonadota bacterium]